MDAITSIIPVPRSVPLGGRRVLISELRLRDVAELQSVLDDRQGDPLAGVLEAVAGTDGDARRAVLVDAHRRSLAGPETYFREDGMAYFRTPAGEATFLFVAVRRHRPRLSARGAAKLWEAASREELDRVWRICHGVKARDAIEGMIGMAAPRKGRTATWPELIDELALARSWTYEQIYNLTLSEWRTARSGGKPAHAGRRVSHSEAMAAMREQRRRYHGDGI